MKREWAIPVALGLLVAAGLWAVPDDAPDASEGDAGATPTGTRSSSSGPPPMLLLPFGESRGAVGDDTTFLVLTPQGRAAAEAHLNESGLSQQTAHDLDWVNDRLADYSPRNSEQGCRSVNGSLSCHDPAWVFHPWPLPKALAVPDDELGPRFGRDGHNATRATIYVFDEAALLVASDAPANQTSRFGLHPDFVRLPSGTWYLGANGTAPNGTAFLPSLAQPLVDRLRPLLDGLPEGGVASARSNAYVGLYGTLFVTIRIDDLVLAP